MRTTHRISHGFTLTELLMVVVLVGVLAVAVLPRFDRQPFDEAAFALELTAALRYAQRLAVASGCPVQAVADAAADTLSLYFPDGSGASCGASAGFTVPVPSPRGGGAYVVAAGNDVDLTTSASFFFDALGRPQPGGVVLAVGGRSIVVEPQTGYVH